MPPERVVPGYYGHQGTEVHGARKRRKTVEDEEARTWVRFYQRVGDAELAAEVLALLETEADVRRDHPALMLLCRESLRRRKHEEQRRKRLAHAIQLLARCFVAAPAVAIWRLAVAGVDLLVECLQPASREGARGRVRSLPTDPGVPRKGRPAEDGNEASSAIPAAFARSA
jgi:hypothetical protein